MIDADAAQVLTSEGWVRSRPVTPKDGSAMAGLRALVEPNKGQMRGPSARPAFDGIMLRVPAPEGVSFEAGVVGGIAGWWCWVADTTPGRAILHLHGGWYNWGTAHAFRHLVGHIAVRAGADAFIPDYRLAPEHPFPAAPHDVQACYRGLADMGHRVAVVGDSAGGGLALGLLPVLAAQAKAPVGAVALSPVTDLTLAGASWASRAAADPYFTKDQVKTLVDAYLAGHDPSDPLASPLYAELSGLPPIRLHVGDDEVLLDDSRVYVDRAVAAGVDATLDVWNGMPHGFLSGVGRVAAADHALAAIGAFLSERFEKGGS
ncbi:alpha/beta hydrolase fold domain-containing protein [Sphingomonas sp. PAMC 26621]|uniref:alpha/beta hydrolase fold domain-containing protein n=1 Tax=Sphingomonas sp. PAMC 26621 TaxID=1112213 RepID=UPI0006876DFE|nr:alpha/beta hydrolase fold domain-containing protein [Sphingomonas sp. PAMC 26621]